MDSALRFNGPANTAKDSMLLSLAQTVADPNGAAILEALGSSAWAKKELLFKRPDAPPHIPMFLLLEAAQR